MHIKRWRGLAELERWCAQAARQIDADTEDTTRELAADEAGRIRQAASTPLERHAARPIRVAGSQIVMEGPTAMGAEFGGRGRRTTMQFQPYRAGGRFFWPTLRGDIPQIFAALGEPLDTAERTWGAG